MFGSELVGFAELDVFGRNDNSVLAPRNQRRAPMMRAVWKVLPGMKSCTRGRRGGGADQSQRVRAVVMQHKHLDRVAEIVVELMVLDAVKLYRGCRGHHEVERRA